MQLPAWSLTRDIERGRRPWEPALLFVAWLLLVIWLAWDHALWRDEVRAFSLALSGSNLFEMLHNIHGEGHPALWYLILRSVHDLFPHREILPLTGIVIGVAAMAIVTFWSPFRTMILAFILFSLFGGFEYVVIARNYGISVLTMFVLAALYQRVKNSIWLGVFIIILCNTNVPSCILGAAFLLFRLVELLTDRSVPNKHEWWIFIGNCLLGAVGALVCFRTVYPTFNDGAVSTNIHQITGKSIISALIDSHQGFSNIGLSLWSSQAPIFLFLSCLSLIRNVPAFCSSIFAFIALKLFFYFVYLSYYRHEALFVVFLICLHWIIFICPKKPQRSQLLDAAHFTGICALIEILVIQSVLLSGRIHDRLVGLPYSRSAEVAKLLRKSELHRSIVMGDPDTMLEPLPYYVDNPIWFLREQRFGTVVRLTRKARQHISLDDIVSDARKLNRWSKRPVVFISRLPLNSRHDSRYVLFDDTTSITPASYKRFITSMRLIARLRPATTDEAYDVYVFPR